MSKRGGFLQVPTWLARRHDLPWPAKAVIAYLHTERELGRQPAAHARQIAAALGLEIRAARRAIQATTEANLTHQPDPDQPIHHLGCSPSVGAIMDSTMDSIMDSTMESTLESIMDSTLASRTIYLERETQSEIPPHTPPQAGGRSGRGTRGRGRSTRERWTAARLEDLDARRDPGCPHCSDGTRWRRSPSGGEVREECPCTR